MNEIDEMYRTLLEAAEGEDPSTNLFTGGRSYDDDDSEDFLTSKEIIKQKEQLEEHYGISPKGDGTIEEEVHFKRYTKRREHKYTEKELEQIKESCICTIVHDYGENDKYHMTDEERSENDILDEIGMKLDSLKRTYRKVDQYIEAMRVVVQAWEMLEAKGNFIHTREEFFQMVSEGKIVSNRIIMPKLKRIDTYNQDMIIKYISNPELDPSDLVPEPIESEDDWYNDNIFGEDGENEEGEIDEMIRLLSPEEFEFIQENEDNPPKFVVKDISSKLIKGYDRRDFGRRRKKRKGNKSERYIREGLHELLNKIQNNAIVQSRNSTRSHLITHSIFDVDKPGKDVWEDLYFDGSWANDNDLLLYDLAVREELLKQHPNGKGYLTYADYELSTFFSILEDNGINTIDLRRKMDYTEDGVQKVQEKREKRANKKIESALIQRITELNKSSKFKKIVSKAEDALNKQIGQY